MIFFTQGKKDFEVNDAWRFYEQPAPSATDSEERLIQEVAGMI